MSGGPVTGFHHAALLYTGVEDFLLATAPLLEGALAAGEPVLVAVDREKADALRDVVGSAGSSIEWKDMRGIGLNPARIIPLWRRFVSSHRSAARLWGIGEPVWPERTPAELEEAQEHERLLDVAFAAGPPFTLVCPYDAANLAPEVIEEARRSHAHVAGTAPPSPAAAAGGPWPPSEPSGPPSTLLPIDGATLTRVRRHLARSAPRLEEARAVDLGIAIIAVSGHMAARGVAPVLRLWVEPGRVIAEIDGLDRVDDVLSGREWPPPAGGSARGLWLANQLCDLVRLRRTETGSAVRLHLLNPDEGRRPA